MRTRVAILTGFLLLIGLSFIDAPYPEELIMQHIPTVIGLLAIAGWDWRFGMSARSFGCLMGFTLLHVIGARWIYSFVPYDQWSERLFGRSLSEHFGWQRNHYDRLVHFASGVLGTVPVSECLQRWCGMQPRGAAVMAVSGVLAIGAVYEVAEWQIAITFAPEFAEAYNGQQGDPWDPQKDLALAGLGALISSAFLLRWKPSLASH